MNPGAKDLRSLEWSDSFRRLLKVMLVLSGLVVSLSTSIRQAGNQTITRPNRLNGDYFSRGCSDGNDRTLLTELDRVLRKNVAYYKEFPHIGFFVYDLTDPSKSYISSKQGAAEKGCITFKDDHVYHFSTVELAASKSQIAIMEGGRLKIFDSINCKSGEAGLANVLRYAEQKLKGREKNDTITRLGNYRRYGAYQTVDEREYRCGNKEIAPNSDKLYSRQSILNRFSAVLRSSMSDVVQRNYPDFLVEEERAVGFFVYDLTEPTNKQTSLLERIEFKNGHVYHFADIDLPFSYSNIAVLEDGQVRIFKAINCAGKGDNLNEVISYLNEKLKRAKNQDEIIHRVSDYRRYGVYVSLNGLSTPQCEQAK